MLIQPFSFSASSVAVPRLLRLGLYWQGGYIVYLTGNYPNQSGLIVAPVQISSAMTWPSIGGVSTPLNQGYGFGYSNTEAAYGAGYTTDGIGTCWNYESDGYTDWFMPSTDELGIVIANQSYIPYTLTATGYHSSSAYGPNPGNQNLLVANPSGTITPVNHSNAEGIVACRYITT
jgi:hypothetical protein